MTDQQNSLCDMESVAMDSPRVRWIKDHRFATHHAPHMENPWMAVRLTEDHVKRGLTVGEAMAEECRLYDEAGQIAEADTEEDAIVELAKKLNLKLWNE